MKIALLFLLLAGCASVPQTIRIPITPSCDVRNALEQCKPICLIRGQRAIQAIEDDKTIDCNCAPFDAYRLPPPWREPGPRRALKRAA